MSTIIFDIETIPVDFESLDQTQRQYLLKYAKTAEEQDKVKEQLALWAPTNQIIAIGMLSAESDAGAVYFQSPDKQVADFEDKGIKYSTGTEKEILQKFWKAISHANNFVTFNGRGFDCPVLMLRSAVMGVRSEKNLMPYRYSTDYHVDLLEQFTFYGAYRKFNLDMYCKTFAIHSPKQDGISGKDIQGLFQSGDYDKIAKYCAGDLYATKELYFKWKQYLRF